MYVCQLQIEGFRGIKSACLKFERHTVLLGANNVGNAGIIDALGLVLGRDRLVRTLGDYDFFGGLPSPTSRIRIVATITGFDPDDPNEHFDWFNTKDGSVPFWWDGATVHAGDRPQNASLCTQIAFVARFDEENLEVEPIRYFLDGDGDPFENQDFTTVKLSHLKSIGFFLLPSHRTWDRVVSFGSELFRRVLRFQSAIPSKAVTDLRENLRDPSVKLEDDPHIHALVERVNSEIDGFIGSDSSGLRFRPTGGDVEGILQALTPHLRGKGDTVLPVSKHGSGVISLQTLLLLFEFGRARHENGENFILAAEEPELHLHPGHHSRLVARIRGTSNQSITTTHSPEIAAYYHPSELLLLRNEDGVLKSFPLVPAGESVPDKNALMRLYTLHRAAICEALMHQTIIVPEGPTEYHWLRALFRLRLSIEGWDKACGTDADKQAIGLIPTPDSHVVTIYERFQPLLPKVVPLVDGDAAGDGYVKSLIKLTAAPLMIIQLAKDCCLESLLAWLLTPSTAQDWTDLVAIMPDLGSHDETHLVECLTKNKVNWRRHEELVGYIGEKAAAKQRLADLHDGLCEILETGSTTKPCWKNDSTTNNASLVKWRWVAN